MSTPNHLLRNARLSKGISLRKLARELGVSPTTLYRWEQGLQDPYPIHKGKLCLFFEKDLSELGFGLAFDAESVPEEKRPRFRSSFPDVLADVTLVGRTYDLAAVRQKMFSGYTALVGLPGVGKTTLALELASDPEICSHFLDGILWADLGPTPHLDDLLRSWSTLLLHVSPQKRARLTREKTIAALREAIGEQRICLILDDVWASDDARTLLQIAGPNCGVLITTRSPIVSIELVIREFYTLSELDEEAGLHLLSLLAPQAVELEPGQARELVRAVGGLPLALTLMGHYVTSEAWSGHARRIAQALERLKDANERLNTGERSLRSMIALSERLLPDATRTVFHALSLFPPKPGSFSEQAALAVAGCETKELDILVDLGLLEPIGEEHYRMHQTIYDYCQSYLTPTERRDAEDRLLTYMLNHLDTKPEPTWLEQEKHTILIALRAATRLERDEECIHLTLHVALFLINLGWLSLVQTHLHHACTLARRGTMRKQLPKLLLYLGKTFAGLARLDEAIAAYQEGLSLARHFHDDETSCELLATLAWQSHVWGEYEQADIYLHEGLEMATSLDLPDILWVLFRVQGSQAWARGDYAQAERAYQRGLSLVERLHDQSLADVGMYYCFLAVFEGERGHYAQAEAYFQQGMLASQLYGFKDLVPFILARRAMMRLMYDPSQELREELEQAIHTAQAVGSWGFAVYAYKALAQLELAQGHLERAEEVAHQALAIIEPFQTQNRLGEHYTILAQIALARGRYTEAATSLQQALPLLRRYGASEDQAIALVTLGELEIARGNLDAADAAFCELFAVGPADFLTTVALGHYGLARLAALRHHWREARQVGEKSLRMLEALKHIRTSEVRNWLATVRQPFFQSLLRKRDT